MCRPLVLLGLLALWPAGVSAQSLPSGPVTAFDGRLAVGGEVSATIGSTDESAYFNYTDYEHNTMRMVRLALAAAWRPASRIELVGEVRSENLNQIRAYAAYVRIRPWRERPLDVQVGRIPPSFGAYGRRAYQTDNGLIGYPLAYQYLTPLRSDAIPATVTDLLAMRARGWRTNYPIGSPEAAPGVPVISAFRWDTGVQAHWEGQLLDLTGSVTTGTLSAPRARDDNHGKQLSARATLRPVAGLVVGASTARGEFLSTHVIALLPEDSGPYAQTAFGADAEYSRDHWLVRGELVWSRWNVPFAASQTTMDLDSLGGWIEGRYRITPRIVAAARVDGLQFSRIDVGPNFTQTWDAPVKRVEVGAGYSLQRNLVLRLAVQYNDRDGGRIRSRTYVSGQIAYWF
jgi:hypothetical protein